MLSLYLSALVVFETQATARLSGKNLKLLTADFRQQIVKNTEVKKQDRLDYLEEGKRVRNKLAEDRMKIEIIKARKL